MVVGSASAVTYKTLHRFKADSSTGGSYPYGPLIIDSTGDLFGTTVEGGNLSCNNQGVHSGCGLVFKLTRNQVGTWTKTILHRFSGADGSGPGSLILDAAGTLYGTAGGGRLRAGLIYKLTPNPDGTWTEKVLHDFKWTVDGGFPGGLFLDEAGNLYGTTGEGGVGGKGTVFKLILNSDDTWTLNLLFTFGNGPLGGPPRNLLLDTLGNIYSTAGGGDCFGGDCGYVFKLTPNPDGGWTKQVLHRFAGGKDGSRPFGGLTIDAAGNLYGTTAADGAYVCNSYPGCGTIFKLSPNFDGTWTEHILHWFNEANGSWPLSGLVLDAAGALYGTTYYGGRYGYGVVFMLQPTAAGGWAEKILWSFRNQPGAFPSAGVVFDGSGNLYGTTAGGGVNTFGTVFEITP
jgi:uncharacterized repeat protein (TIGR03803 family)